MNMIKQSKLSIDQLCPDQRILYCCFYSTDTGNNNLFCPKKKVISHGIYKHHHGNQNAEN
ncbi:unnamed protein product [Musa hybrid cultivar]